MAAAAQTLRGHHLVICEKPDAARRIAEALSDGKAQRLADARDGAYLLEYQDQTYVVTAALGHLYTVSDPGRTRSIYPVFDIDWFPTHAVEREAARTASCLRTISQLAQGAIGFIHACDFDQEGETIGFNILRYACGGQERAARRAKFSTLTRAELRHAFATAAPGTGAYLAAAGRARHEIDFLYGVNLSRALTEAFRIANQSYRTVSIGRVQGPTLRFIVDREIEIRTFVPTPYWTITALLEKGEARFAAGYSEPRILQRAEAETIRQACGSQPALVEDVRASRYEQAPPTPFNLGDLQREAFRVFHYTPRQTLQLAERLYLDALISYPRTGSEKLPPSIDYSHILRQLSQHPSYRDDASQLLQLPLRPHEGAAEDPAHPAIYPTGEFPHRTLNVRENRLYDLIVRRFFAVFAPAAIRERVAAALRIAGYVFRATGRRTLEEGWLHYYRLYSAVEEEPLPPLTVGEQLRVISLEMRERFEQPPPRYNQASLLQRLEDERLGTKATRADIINTLYERGYVVGDRLTATDIGFTVMELMETYSPDILSPGMTRTIEEQLEAVERGAEEPQQAVAAALAALAASLPRIKEAEVVIGRQIRAAAATTLFQQSLLGPCPQCREGQLRIIQSRTTGKRFVGCTNYGRGCQASAPLPQKGTVRPAPRPCTYCGWPIIYVRTRRIPWRLCVNPQCPSKPPRLRQATTPSPTAPISRVDPEGDR